MKAMEAIYLEEYKAEEGLDYCIDQEWLSGWLVYMKRLGSRRKPNPIDNKHLQTKINKGLAIHMQSDYYCITRKLWVMFTTVYGGGPEVLDPMRQEEKSSRREERTTDEERKRDSKRGYELHLLENIPAYPAKYTKNEGVVGFSNNYLYCYLNACL